MNFCKRFIILLVVCHSKLGAEPLIIESIPIHFGQIQYTTNATCELTLQGVLTGACEDIGGNVVLGEIVLTNLTKNEKILITLTGSSNNILSFVPNGEIKNTKGGVKTLLNGQSVEVSANGSGSDISITIYGQIQSTSSSGQWGEINVDYTIEAVSL